MLVLAYILVALAAVFIIFAIHLILTLLRESKQEKRQRANLHHQTLLHQEREETWQAFQDKWGQKAKLREMYSVETKEVYQTPRIII